MRLSSVLVVIVSLLIVACDTDSHPAGSSVADSTTDGGPGGVPDVIGDTTGPGDSATSTWCARDIVAALMAEAVSDAFLDATMVVAMSGQSSAGYAVRLLGTDRGQGGSASLFMPCTEPIDFDPYCSSDNPEEAETAHCLQAGCDGPGVLLSTFWYADVTASDYEASHPYRYATDHVAGEAVYDPNPRSRWRIDASSDPIMVSSSYARHVTIVLEDGTTADLSHDVLASVTGGGDHGIGDVDISVRFHDLDAEAHIALDPIGHPVADLHSAGIDVGYLTIAPEHGDTATNCPGAAP